MKPKKSLGQNFLTSESAIHKIIIAAKISRGETVLEVGPGRGALTKALLAAGARVGAKIIAIEKDHALFEKLLVKFSAEIESEQLKIIEGDIMEISHENMGLAGGNYKIVANIPYYLTSFLIRNFLEADNQPKEIILLIQKEVAQRICAKPPQMSILAVSVQFYAYPKILFYVKKGSFWPKPKVDGAVIKIVSRKFRVRVSRRFSEQFFRIVRAGFSQPRKQILNNLSKNLKIDREKVKEWLKKNKINPTQRAETLNLEDWNSLTKSFYS